MMKIIIDGDACPVISIAEKIAQKVNIELIIFCDLAHQIESDCGQVICVDSINQSVDMAIYSKCKERDIVITQDYGLAALVLGKGARAVNEYGLQYTENNINHLLMKRHLHSQMRRAGKTHSSHSKRKEKDDLKFRDSLLKMVNEKV